jgi:hypothetical protein
VGVGLILPFLLLVFRLFFFLVSLSALLITEFLLSVSRRRRRRLSQAIFNAISGACRRRRRTARGVSSRLSRGLTQSRHTNTQKKTKQTKQTTLDTGDNRRPSTNRQTKFFSSSSGALPVYLIFFLDTFTTWRANQIFLVNNQFVCLFVFYLKNRHWHERH